MIQPISSQDIPWTEAADVPGFNLRYRHLTQAVLGDKYQIGVAIEELAPGNRSAPFHYHIFEEEHVFILEGRVTLRLGAATHEMKAGDYACFPAGQKAGHCLVNDGDATCRYVIVGERNPNEICVYPDSNKIMVRALGRGTVFDMAARRHYWEGEAAGLPPAAPFAPVLQEANPKPPIASGSVEREATRIGTNFVGEAQHLTFAAIGRDYRVGVLIEAPAPGKRLAPRHYHMLEEEHALILAGEVSLLLGDKIHVMKPGDYVCFPAGEKLGHSFMNSGAGPCSYLMIGARNPNDVCVYPDSNKMAVSTLRTEEDIFDMSGTRRYWDGEAIG